MSRDSLAISLLKISKVCFGKLGRTSDWAKMDLDECSISPQNVSASGDKCDFGSLNVRFSCVVCIGSGDRFLKSLSEEAANTV